AVHLLTPFPKDPSCCLHSAAFCAIALISPLLLAPAAASTLSCENLPRRSPLPMKQQGLRRAQRTGNPNGARPVSHLITSAEPPLSTLPPSKSHRANE